MKNVVFVSPYGHHGAHSGARKRAEALCHVMQQSELLVTCISPWLPPDGIQHIFISLDGSLLNRLKDLFKIMTVLHKIKPDLVISESPLCPFTLGKFRVFHVIHDSKFFSTYARRGASLAMIFQWFSVRIADKVVTVSGAERERIGKHLGISVEKIAVSYNGISDEWIIRPRPPTSKCRKFDILYVSNFAKHKGHLRLLELIKDKNYSLAFVGSDFGEFSACKQYADRHRLDVTFFSNLSESDLISIYDDSRLFVFPSEFEGFGIPFIEARARGLPVLANCIPVFGELQSLIGGHIVDFNDDEKVASLLSTILSDQTQNYVPPVTLYDFRWKSISANILSI